MLRFLVQERVNWTWTAVEGSRGFIRHPPAGTKSDPWKHNPDWFPGESTLILGDGASDPNASWDGSSAVWLLSVDPRLVTATDGGFLVVAGKRSQGALHTAKFGACASIFLNGESSRKEIIGLRDIPPGRTDYAYVQDRNPALPYEPRVRACNAVFTWPVEKNELLAASDQRVRIDLDRHVSSDIDYVALALRRPRKELGPVVKQTIVGLLVLALAAIGPGVVRWVKDLLPLP